MRGKPNRALTSEAAEIDRGGYRSAWWFYPALRVGQMVPTLILIILAVFILLQLAPGDLAQTLAGESGGGSPEYLAALRRTFGHDQPVYFQFLRYMLNVLKFDLGFSFRNNSAVSTLIAARLPATLLLAVAALAMSITLGIVGGVISSMFRGRWPDRLVSMLSLFAYSTPSFLVGAGLILLFGVGLSWFPVGGFVASSGVDTPSSYGLSVLRHLVLPAITLGLFYSAIYARLTRAAMLDVAGQDYIKTAISKGLPPWRVNVGHVLRNALLPLVTVIGMQGASVLGGAILVETVFAWPGVGRLAFEAMQQRDYNLLAGLVLCGSVVVLTTNLIVDIVYAALDPRVRIR